MTKSPLHTERLTFDPTDKDQEAQLIALFSEAFGDQYKEYYAIQLRTLASTEHTFIFGYKGEIAAHIQVVPYVYQDISITLPMAYLYAVCTLGCMRGQGIMKNTVMPTVLDEVYKAGYGAAFLVPSSTDLIDFYKPLGFEWMPTKAYYSDSNVEAPLILPGQEALAYEKAIKTIEEQTPFDITTEEMPLEAGWMIHRPSPNIISPHTSIIRPLT